MFPVYLDENAQDSVLVSLLRRDGVDCLTANEARTGGIDDASQLKFAADKGRAIVTLDKEDFQRLHAQWMQEGHQHAGILVVTSVWLPPQAVHGAIMGLQRERSAPEMTNAILFIGGNSN